MGQFDFVSRRAQRKAADYSKYSCPYCGAPCSINMSECPSCRNSLVEYEGWRFAKYNLYNRALQGTREGNLLAALEDISVFLDHYPLDRDGNRLRLLIAHALNDVRFDVLVDDYIRESNDKWAAEFQDDPNGFSADDFQEKTHFIGVPQTEQQQNPAALTLAERIGNANELVDVINRMYELYNKCRALPKSRRNRRTLEYLHFYEAVFSKYLYRADISVIDYMGIDYFALTDEQQMLIGDVRLIHKKRQVPGTVVQVHLPEIRFKNLILQRAQIEVASPSSTKRLTDE